MITHEHLDQLRHLLRPIATKVANTVARCVLQLVDDSAKMQAVQIGVLDGETIDNAEHYQPYGFFSVPFPGAEGVVVFPNGDRSHPLVVVMSDRRHRPTGGRPGEAGLRTDEGDEIRLARNNEIVAATSGHLRLGSADADDPVARKSDLDAIKSAILNAIATAIPQVAPAATGPAALGALKTALSAASWPTGSTKVMAE
jgi:phage baseplate assembly protein V